MLCASETVTWENSAISVSKMHSNCAFDGIVYTALASVERQRQWKRCAFILLYIYIWVS